MFSKRERYSFKKGLPKNVLNSPSFSIRYEKNDKSLRVAVVASKKVDKRAAIRNKIKRKISEAIRKKISIDSPFNLIFYAKRDALNAENLEAEIEESFIKIKNV